jgi:phytoene dehydrogenase-like protein
MLDVAVIGGGIAGMATAARLQARGLATAVFEAHGQPGGCAGFFRRRGFAFDVGATTLVDFQPGGVGGELLADVGLGPLDGEALAHLDEMRRWFGRYRAFHINGDDTVFHDPWRCRRVRECQALCDTASA